MPNYRGIDVLQYECDRMDAFNAIDNNKLICLEDQKDLYPADVYASLTGTYKSFIKDRSEKLAWYKSKLAVFLQANTPEESTLSYDPLEFLYQEFLQNYLSYLLRCVENAYRNHYDSILSNSVVFSARAAKKVAIHNLHHHTVGNIVQKFLREKQIQELRELPQGISDAISAIQSKYEYFEDRLGHCVEIGDKIRELQKS